MLFRCAQRNDGHIYARGVADAIESRKQATFIDRKVKEAQCPGKIIPEETADHGASRPVAEAAVIMAVIKAVETAAAETSRLIWKICFRLRASG
ncbi:MAG: hypothetical protein KJN99_09265 [Marinicaulis sp.]|nr:hypothetical protein [Marinicaulis sp.]